MDESPNPSCKISEDLIFFRSHLPVRAPEPWSLERVALGDGTKLVQGPGFQCKCNSVARITDSQFRNLPKTLPEDHSWVPLSVLD